MTDRLYYTDSYLTEFEATVQSVGEIDGRRAVVLDRTAFYPTSGGQPFDVGSLNGVRVTDVIDQESDGIAHIIEDREDSEDREGELHVGDRVRGMIDWPRRFEHMQQHTGQHVLSAAFERVASARTVSFHLGADVSTIDLHREVALPEIHDAEEAANQVVWEDRPVIIRFTEAEEAKTLPLRKEPLRTGTLRIIEIPDVDVSACGGTHVARTGAIGLVSVLGHERFRGGMRVSFVCGVRALRSLRTFSDAVTASLRFLSVDPAELPSAIERAQAENKGLKREIKHLQERLAPYEAAELAASGQRIGEWTIVARVLEGCDAPALKALARAVASRAGYGVALFSATPPYLVVVARSADVKVDAAAVLKSLMTRFGGRGGGRPDLAQGGGLQGPLPEILHAATDALTVGS
ncbi:MAG: alanyl-tRNA editing protein [Acidobacteria bacterium]|nr:alanyl-tRNA editing protein [Acidobacteriota bacterium]